MFTAIVTDVRRGDDACRLPFSRCVAACAAVFIMSARSFFTRSATRPRRTRDFLTLFTLLAVVGGFLWWRQAGSAPQQKPNLPAANDVQSEITSLKKLVAKTQDEAQHEQRLKYLRRLVELQPQNVESLTALAKELYVGADDVEVLPIIERLLQKKPDFAPAYLWRGVARFSGNPTTQQLKQAEADLKKALQLQSNNVEAHRYLARVYMRLNQPDQAITQFEAVGRGRPYASAHWLELSNAYRKAGNPQKAESWRKRFVALKEENSQLKNVWDRLALSPEDFDSNLRMATLLLRSLDSSEDNYQLYRFRYAKQPDNGVEHYVRKAVQLRPHDARVQALARQLEQTFVRHLQAARQAQARGNFERAQWHLDHVRLLGPDDTRTQQAVHQLAPAAPHSPVAR